MKIGLTYTGSPEKHDNYVRWIQDGDENIHVIRFSVEDTREDLINSCDGLVLSGGVDIHPSIYGGGLEYNEAPLAWKMERDEFEKGVLTRALAADKPVLGVCRGLQLINVAFGGTLMQDLGFRGDDVHQNRPADKEHAVIVEPETVLYEISGGVGLVNSAHHQAIGELGQGLRINCRAEDGTIEGIEWKERGSRPFMLAVQWHPERMYKHFFRDFVFYKSIRDRFIEEVKKPIVIR